MSKNYFWISSSAVCRNAILQYSRLGVRNPQILRLFMNVCLYGTEGRTKYVHCRFHVYAWTGRVAGIPPFPSTHYSSEHPLSLPPPFILFTPDSYRCTSQNRDSPPATLILCWGLFFYTSVGNETQQNQVVKLLGWDYFKLTRADNKSKVSRRVIVTV